MPGRRKLDAYYSPASVAQWLLQEQEVGINLTDTILECAVGDGAIAKPLKTAGYRVWTNDIDPDIRADYHEDICTWNPPNTIDWIITNPPFNCLNEALPLLFDSTNKGLALFVRKSITEPTFARQNWLKQHQKHLAQIIFCPRVSFTGDGKTDNSSCDWYIWTRQPASGCKISWITK
jgi:hypothetical protein